jgi:DNA-directed RNA polymerase specialized sigma subunit
MGKLKEKLLNNLTPEEMDERFEISAFEYVEYMEKYKNWKQLSLFDDNGDVIPEDVLEQILREKEIEEQQFYEQSAIDEINDSLKLKYTDNDILYVLNGLAGPVLTGMILDKLRDVWNTKNGVE